MTVGTISSQSLIAQADILYPPTGTIGHVILLSGTLAIGVQLTVSGNVFTTVQPHKLVTGSRVRVASTAGVPSPLSATTDYYAIVLSATTFSLAAAAGGAAISLTDAGTGTLTLNEQSLNAEDSLAVLINKELPNVNGYARMPLTNMGAAALVGGQGEKSVNVNLTNSSTTANIDYLHVLVALGANNTIGSTAGITSRFLVTESTIVTTLPQQARVITVTLGQAP